MVLNTKIQRILQKKYKCIKENKQADRIKYKNSWKMQTEKKALLEEKKSAFHIICPP